MKRLLIFLGILLTTVSGWGQELPVFNSPSGPVILFGGAGSAHYSLSRTEGATVKPLPLPGMVKSFTAFKKIVGAPFVGQLAHQLKLKSEDALWPYLQQHTDLTAYSLASFNIPFRVAMGVAYIDEEVKGQKGRTYTYRIQVDNRDFTGTLTIGQSPDFGAPFLSHVSSGDSVIDILWKGTLRHDIPYFATVYRQSSDRGDFVKLSSRVLAKRKGDTVTYRFTERVNGNTAYRYFIRPTDLLDNAGAYNSDTANLIAANYLRLPIINGLKAHDTLNAIVLSWQPLAANPLITGIEVQRSRDPRGDYVVMDTISPMSSGYTDRKLLPHVGYYYRLCVLHAGKQLQSEKFYATVSAEQQKTSRTPDAPYGITARPNPRGVAIAWHPIDDPDLYAYYVYRGTSMSGKMQIISPALTDTLFTDTASNLSSRTDYVYAVKAVSNANKESAFSSMVAAHLPKGRERPLTPGGISLITHNGILHIQWEDTKRNDPGILGYILYKCKAGRQALQYDISKPASAEATRMGLSLVVAGVIRAPFFDDTIARNGDKYEYLVSAIDIYGVESGLSPAATTAPFKMLAKPPSQVFARAVTEGVRLQWEQADSAGVQGFAVYRRAITEKKARKIAAVGKGVGQYTDKQAASGTLYVYTITVLTASGESAPSDERSIRK